jgi:hypothetical protein
MQNDVQRNFFAFLGGAISLRYLHCAHIQPLIADNQPVTAYFSCANKEIAVSKFFTTAFPSHRDFL